MNELSEQLALIEQLSSLSQGGQPLRVAGFTRGDLEVFLASLSLLHQRNICLVLKDEKQFFVWQSFLEELVEEAGKLKKTLNAAQCPSLKLWGSDRFVNQTPFVAQRLHALFHLIQNDASITLTTLAGLAQRSFTTKTFKTLELSLSKGVEQDVDSLQEKLIEFGYVSRTVVEEEGQFAIRGGVVDLFSPNYDHPVRIEFFGDDVSSIRSFSMDSQRSLEDLEAVVIVPSLEVCLRKAARDQDAQIIYEQLLAQDVESSSRDGIIRSFLAGYRFSELMLFSPLLRRESDATMNYLSDDCLLIFPEGMDVCWENFRAFSDECQRQHDLDLRQGKASVAPKEHYLSEAELKACFAKRTFWLELGDPVAKPGEKVLVLPSRLDRNMPASIAKKDSFDQWISYLESLSAQGKTFGVIATQTEHIKRISSLFEHRGTALSVKPALAPLLAPTAKPNAPFVVEGELSNPVWIHGGSTLLVPETTLFAKPPERKRASSRKLQNYISSFRELKVGSLIVHVDHGIGRYLGMTSLEAAGSRVDCLQLEYAGGDRIYVPVDRLRLLQRYNTGGEAGGESAPLDKLKGAGWQKRKSGVRKALRDMADELLKLQAKREMAAGLSFHSASEEYRKFEAEFPYIETEDQLRAIADVNADVEKSRPMDRLVCGDVGFGKTEVALRAAYRAVLEGYQVVVLVPTTVLCYQHYRTFVNRLEKHGVRIAQANRFVKTKQLQDDLKGLAEGKVDIMIGTHRVLSKDVNVKSLGMLIIDEEQRFGVTHKERMKQFRADCHILTLTATPIPRTLHMAMLGLRDISIVATPPHDRLAVKTYISQFDEALLKDAITSEIARGGQVFFVHNRIEDIVALRNRLQILIPDIDIRIAHGQMGEDKLEKVVIDFINNRFPVLLCTTIIESGIDMPNVNTLIVNDAHRYGLAQLYQIRGRVGRSTRQAYAYLLVPPEERLSDESRTRLEVISAHQELGAGFQIARYDLEIRGAGNLLGGEQSGKIAEIGLDLYTEMLEQAIAEVKGKELQQKVDTEIKIPFAALIPPAYISEEGLRLDIYKRIFSIENADELSSLKSEVQDRFGNLPNEVELLLGVAKLKWMLRTCNAQSLLRNQFGDGEIKFSSLNEAQIANITKIIAENPRAYRLSPDFKLIIPLKSVWDTAIAKQLVFMDELIGKLEPLVNEMDRNDDG